MKEEQATIHDPIHISVIRLKNECLLPQVVPIP
eukprot:Gb_01218 [translate_table: standard]